MAKQSNLFRRHLASCPHRAKGRSWRRCSCPIWLDEEINWKRRRKSLGTCDWDRAIDLIRRDREDPGSVSAIVAQPAAPVVPKLVDCIATYISDCKARKLAESTVVSYQNTFNHLVEFCSTKHVTDIDKVDLPVLTAFRASREIEGTTSGKELEHVRTFGGFASAKKRGWWPENYARDIKAPKEESAPTMPFDEAEVNKILRACDHMKDGNPNRRQRTRLRARAMVLTMVYSGLRISDTIKLRRSQVDLQSGQLLLRTMKTGYPLYVRLGETCVEALRALPVESEEYFFWNGESKLATAIGNARKTISRVLALAGLEGSPHCFRDTFSVDLLTKHTDIRVVQQLLGHTSIKTTEKHYAPWVTSFQAALDEATAKLNFGSARGAGTRRIKSGKLLKMRA
jgi:site-specific recombinase XerD